MSSTELRQKFLKFFEERGHVIVPSSSLIPDDPSVLLTTAGMQQFKLYYTGELDPMTAIHGTLSRPLGSKNAASVQKSFRTSDIDKVGDESHLTFFEMLGNFSFGGYFKEDAIKWAWEFIHHVLGVPLERVKISVFEGDAEVPPDKESHDIWRKLGIPDGKIIFGTRDDNFWGPTGNEGPCGPTTEIYVDDVEVWNLVFNEFYQHPDKQFDAAHCPERVEGRLEPLKVKGVDTGMGLERLSLVMQYPGHQEKTIFETDLFRPVMDLLPSGDERARRIIADHMRASIFLAAEGIRPSNAERGYILRRLLRRAARYALLLGLEANWYEHIAVAIVETYRYVYPELDKVGEVKNVVGVEFQKFEKALERGLKEFQKLSFTGKISGVQAFDLYQNYGFPIEMIEELAAEKDISVDRKSFEQEFKKHQEISRDGRKQKFGGHGLGGVSGENARKDPDIWKMTRLHTATHLLHQALRDILGPEAKQMGSDISTERTRFDFTFGRKVTDEELKRIEDIVNQKIHENLQVKREVTPYEEAIKGGALAFFKEKYPDTVSVYSIGSYSRELCGGPHVSRTGEIGKFKILKEEGAGAGVRRIRAMVE